MKSNTTEQNELHDDILLVLDEKTRLVHGMRVRNRGLCVYIFELGWGGDGSMVVCNFFSLISAAFPCPMSYPEVILSPFPYPSRLWLQQPHGRSS